MSVMHSTNGLTALAPANAAPIPAGAHDCSRHRLQLYAADAQVLVSNVSDYLCEGFERGEGLLVIATSEHRRAFERKMMTCIAGADFARAVDSCRIVFLDAQDLLSRLMVDGKLDWERFERIVGAAIGQVRPMAEGLPSRAYGEMVGLLWTAGERDAAILLEDFWNTILRRGDFQLFCAYPIDVFGAEFHTPAVRAVLHSHTDLISSGDDGTVQAALTRAAGGILRSWDGAAGTSLGAEVPEGEAKILWLRERFPGYAQEILVKARQHYSSEKRFRALVENSSDAIALTDPHGCVLYASQSTVRALGYRPEELIGRKIFDFIHSAELDAFRRTMHEMLDKPRVPFQVQWRARCKNDGWCWIEATGSNLLDEPDVSAFVFNFRDISDRKTAETALRESEAALKLANAGLEQFAYAAAHDLQEPIRNVAIYVELLAKKYRDQLDDEAHGLIKVAVDGAMRMQELTRDLLAFTRALDDPDSLPGGSRPVSDANGVFDEVLITLRSLIESAEAQVTRDELPALPIHHAHLVQVLQNLVGNALKYRSAQPPLVHLSVTSGRDEWLVGVADNGVGVPPEYRDQIFRMFKRLHGREVPGSGIGLAICSRIVAHYRGRIWVESQPGGGSIFAFTLPRE
jgi:PAS domain S-box-containing protein